MRRFRSVCLLIFSSLILSSLVLLSCATNHGQLKSISITPATAAGQAQFTAVGIYADGTKISPLQVYWSQGNAWVKSDIVPQGVDITQTGIASCNPIVGTFTIQATAPADPHVSLSQLEFTTRQVYGTAQLTCP